MQESLLSEPSGEAPLGVLLVEDSVADARLVEEELRGHDEVALVWVRSLDQARQALAMQRFDAVLLDLLLPDAHGIDLIDGLRGLAGDAALLVLSGQSSDDLLLARAAIRKGAEDFLPKGARAPFVLPRMIATAVERRRRNGRPASSAVGGAAPPVVGGGDAFWSCCLVTRRVSLSAAAARLLGHAAPAGDRPLEAVMAGLPRPSRSALLRLWCRLRRGTGPVTALLFDDQAPCPGARPQDTLVEARARHDAAGHVVALEGSLVDITAARRLDRLHGAILDQLGHELRTPLTTIRAALGLLHEGIGEPPPHGSAGLLGRAVRNADRLAGILDDILATAPAASRDNRRLPPPVGTDRRALENFLERATAAHRSAAAARGVALVMAPAGGGTRTKAAKPAAETLPADGQPADPPAVLGLIVDALLADSVRRAGAGGRVAIGVTPGDGWTGLAIGIEAAGATDLAVAGSGPVGRCSCGGDSRHVAVLERLIERAGGRLVEIPGGGGGAWRLALPVGV